VTIFTGEKGTLKLINEGCDLVGLKKINKDDLEAIKNKIKKSEVAEIQKEFTLAKLQKANFNANQLKSIGVTADLLRKDFKFDFKSLK